MLVRAETPDSSRTTDGTPAGSLPLATAAAATAPVTDDAVPEGHQGLHSFLYSSGDEEHASQRYEFRQVGWWVGDGGGG